MFTKEQLTTAIEELPIQFSIGELVDKLISIAPPRTIRLSSAESTAQEAIQAYYSSREAESVYARFPSSLKVRALRGVIPNISPIDIQKTAKEWEAERINEKYGA